MVMFILEYKLSLYFNHKKRPIGRFLFYELFAALKVGLE